MEKRHMHEIEVKYQIHCKKKGDIIEALTNAGFQHKATYRIFDRWLPSKQKKESLRLREQRQGKRIKYILSTKKSNEKADEIKNRCEEESIVDEFTKEVLLGLALRMRSNLPCVRKIRSYWEAKIGGRQYSAAIDEVVELGRFSGSYLEIETLVPSDSDDPKAKTDVIRLAVNILDQAYKKEKELTYAYEPKSYKKMARIYQAEQDLS